jgi:hypothetical protein
VPKTHQGLFPLKKNIYFFIPSNSFLVETVPLVKTENTETPRGARQQCRVHKVTGKCEQSELSYLDSETEEEAQS